MIDSYRDLNFQYWKLLRVSRFRVARMEDCCELQGLELPGFSMKLLLLAGKVDPVVKNVVLEMLASRIQRKS